MFTACTPLMTNDICLRIAYTEHVSLIALTKLFTFQRSNGHIRRDVTCQRIEAHILSNLLELFILCQLLVILLNPLRKLFHIIGRSDKLTVLGIEPIGGSSSMACR